jgi:DNA-binding GntR family transcriptional regulator
MLEAPANGSATIANATQPALKQQAYDKLKQLILFGELRAGAVLSVRQMAARLEMSRTPVHAAIVRLEADGLVTLAPQQGVVVKEISARDIANHYQIRQALEPFIVARLAGRLTSKQLELLRQNQARHREALQHWQIIEFMTVDVEFHQLLCRFFGNDEIISVMQQLCDKVQYAIRQIAEQFPQRIEETYNEHCAIVDAIVNNDGGLAAELANEHLERGLRRFWSRSPSEDYCGPVQSGQAFE